MCTQNALLAAPGGVVGGGGGGADGGVEVDAEVVLEVVQELLVGRRGAVLARCVGALLPEFVHVHARVPARSPRQALRVSCSAGKAKQQALELKGAHRASLRSRKSWKERVM